MVVRLSDLPADIGDLHWSLPEFQRRTDELLARAKELTVRDRSLSDTESDLEKHPGFSDLVAAARKRHESLTQSQSQSQTQTQSQTQSQPGKRSAGEPR
jgi:hypothetical protein